jgi:hypothetical protein
MIAAAGEYHAGSDFPLGQWPGSFPTSVVLPEGGAIAGEILAHHTRGIDTQARPSIFTDQKVSREILTEARMKLASLIGLDNAPAFA